MGSSQNTHLCMYVYSGAKGPGLVLVPVCGAADPCHESGQSAALGLPPHSLISTWGVVVGSVCGDAFTLGRSLGMQKDAAGALRLSALCACLSGQCQPILWAACACLKVFGFDNLISASPFLAALSTCWLPCVTLLLLHPSAKNLLTKCIKINQCGTGIVFRAFQTLINNCAS